MKLMFETDAEIKSHFAQELNESTGEKRYVIRGIFSSPGIKNKNGRVYPMSVWEREVTNYQKVINEGLPNCLMEYEHPPYTDVDTDKAVGRINKLWIENGFVMGEAYLLNSPNSAHLRALVDAGIKLSLSSRGLGNVNESGHVTDYKLITFDLIKSLNQSDVNAQMYADVIKEGVLITEDFDVTPEGDIVKLCSKDKCIMEHRDVINEGIMIKFKEIFENINGTEASSDVEVTKDTKTPLKVPTSFANVTLQDFLDVMKMINHTDKLGRYIEIMNMIETLEEGDKYMTFQTIRRINQAVRSKRYIQSTVDKDEQNPVSQEK